MSPLKFPFKKPGNQDYAQGRLKSGIMNQTEKAYDAYLELLQRAGEIQWRRFEGITLKLADDTRYTPDFCVLASDNVLEMHEVKGFFREDSKIKIRVAATMYPFRFIVIKKQAKKDGGGWTKEDF